MKEILNIYLISSLWEFSHRKIFIRYMNRRLGRTLVIQYPVSLTVNLFIKFREKLLGYFLGKFKPGIIENNIEIFTPLILFHKLLWEKSSIFALIDSKLLAYQINKYMKKNFKENIVNFWIYVPVDFYLTKFIKYDNLIYDYYDNHEYGNDGNPVKINRELNIKLAPKCDLINCVSEITAKSMREKNGNVVRNVNGFDPEFQKEKDVKTNNELDKLGAPIIGYSGVLRNWIDTSLLISFLEKTNYYLVCIGYIDRSYKKEFEMLKTYEKFIHIDHLPVDLIPSYIRRFHAGILPYKINNLTKSIFPLKFFEYMCAGIPIVSSPLPEIKKYEESIGYSYTKEDFIENCIKAVNGQYKEKIKNYNEILSNNSWDKVFDNIERNLKNIYKIKGFELLPENKS